MGAPVKVSLKGQTVFLCCAGCEEELKKEPDKYLAKLKQVRGKIVRRKRSLSRHASARCPRTSGSSQGVLSCRINRRLSLKRKCRWAVCERRPRLPTSVDAPEAVLTTRKKFWLVGLVILKRLRFIAILAAVGMFVGYWDTVKNYWDKWIQPSRVAVRNLDPGHEFFCPMHPQVVRADYEPNGDVPKCPICGMPLSVREKGEAVPLPPGITGRVQFTPERVQLAGIQTVAVDYRPVVKQTTTVGYIAFDESRLSRVVSRVEGYVEKLYVDKTFARSAREIRWPRSTVRNSTARRQELAVGHARGPVADLAAAARDRLELLGVGRQEIDAIVALRQGLAAAGAPIAANRLCRRQEDRRRLERRRGDDAPGGGRSVDGLGRSGRV